MNAILNHVWGESRAVDRVWAQVSGLAPSRADKRYLMVLQAFIDDSEKDGWFVLAGYIASAESWAKFSKEWEELLPLSYLDEKGIRQFHMVEMAKSPERMSNVPHFYKVIERHVLCGISVEFKLESLVNAKRRVLPYGKWLDFGYMNNRHLFAIRALLDIFHANARSFKFAKLDEKVDFIFDKRSEKKVIDEAWESYVENRPSTDRDLFGANPRFEDDIEFLPLQAADFWAWWVSRWAAAGETYKSETLEFEGWKANTHAYPRIKIQISEDHIVGTLFDIFKHLESGSGNGIVDLKNFSVSTRL